MLIARRANRKVQSKRTGKICQSFSILIYSTLKKNLLESIETCPPTTQMSVNFHNFAELQLYIFARIKHITILESFTTQL